MSKRIRKLKDHLDRAEFQHVEALDTIDEALANGPSTPESDLRDLKDALAQTRRAVEASRAQLDGATAACARILSSAGADGEDAELSFTVESRRAALDRLDRPRLGAARREPARAPAAIQLGGAFTTSTHREADQQRVWDTYLR